MSNQNESKVNNISKPNILKIVNKIENAYFLEDE